MAKAKKAVGPLDFEQMFDDYNAANQKTWEHDRTKSVGASEAFGCIRKIWFDKFGLEVGLKPDEGYDDSWGALRRGDVMEEHLVVPVIRNHMPKGAKALYTGDEQITIMDSKFPLSATPDGLLEGLPRNALAKYGVPDIKSDSCMFEIKSIDPRATLEHEKEVHYGQVNIQMGLAREELGVDVHFAVILYVDASFYDKITIFIIEFDERVFKAARHRANMVFAADEAIELKAEGRLDNACQYCKWKGPCGEAIVDNIPGKDQVTDDPAIIEAFQPLVVRYKQLKQASDDAEFAFKEVKEEVTAGLLDNKVSRVTSEFWKVSWSPVKGRKTIDKKLLEADGIDVSEYEVEGNGYDRLTINFKNEA